MPGQLYSSSKRRKASMVTAMALISTARAFTVPVRRSMTTKASQSALAFIANSKKNNFFSDHKIFKSIQRPTCRFMSTTSADSTTGTDTKYDIENKENGIIGKYEPQLFESQIYKWWEDAGCFKPDSKQSKDEAKANGREPYVLPMPPPNVTGRLHMGHAIFVALQDVLARFHRMRGRPVLWLPGECIIYI